MTQKIMNLFGKDLSQDVAVVAEIGVNHEGSLDAANRLMRLVIEAGADAVKFQSYSPERYCTASDSERLQRVSRFALSKEDCSALAKEAHRLGVAFLSTPLTEDYVSFLDGLNVPAIKIASGDLTFEPTIRAAARTQRPLILSTGMATIEEIDQTMAWVKEEIDAPLSQRIILLHCVSAYPVPVEQINIRSVKFLADRYDVRIGFSNHTLRMEPCFAAVALGACLIEVHFTDCRAEHTFHDHALSFEPEELSRLIEGCKAVVDSLGSYGKEPAACEAASISLARKGVVASCDLDMGTILSADDLMFARPATEVPACDIARLIGVKLDRPLLKGEQIPAALLE